MRYLLDTHFVYWSMTGDRRLGKAAANVDRAGLGERELALGILEQHLPEARHADRAIRPPTREASQPGTPLGDGHLKEEVDAMLGREIGQARRGRPKKTPSNIL